MWILYQGQCTEFQKWFNFKPLLIFGRMYIVKDTCKQRWASTTTLRALNIFSKTLYEECLYKCVQTWYCTVHFFCTGNFCYKNSILHRQTIYRLTKKMMPFKNKCVKIQIKKFRIKYLLFFTVHAPFHPPNLFSSWNRAFKNIVNALANTVF